MTPVDGLVELSRWQFALTAMYHFLFVPLTLGLSWILFIMESVYVMTGKVIYRDMTKFWGKLFGINFALGVTTGLTMEFQFGTNWSYYSHYVGDIFGAPLAIEGLMAFFLESTFVGLFFFGWDKLSKRAHLATTFLVALGSNLSALWILVANGWMSNPTGSHFNFETMRMELTSFAELFFNPIAQVKFVHTVGAGYVTATMFVLAISSYYLLRGRDLAFARRSFAVATGFGLGSEGFTSQAATIMASGPLAAFHRLEVGQGYDFGGAPCQRTSRRNLVSNAGYGLGVSPGSSQSRRVSSWAACSLQRTTSRLLIMVALRSSSKLARSFSPSSCRACSSSVS